METNKPTEHFQLPENLAALVGWLTDQGFALVEELRAPESFGNWFLLYERGPCRVRLVRDRGQWILDISGPDRDEWFDVDIWLSCLEGRNPPTGPYKLDEHVALLRKSLARIDDALRSRAGIADCLRQRSWWRWRVSMGLPVEQ